MTSEDSFRERLESELAGLRAPAIGEIAGDALAHGRRIRRRERVVGVVGGVAAVAGVTAGAVALGGGFGSGAAGSGASGGGLAPGIGPGVAMGTTTNAPVATPPPTPTSGRSGASGTSPTSAPSSPGTPPSQVLSDSSQSSPNTVIGTIPASWKPPVPAHPSNPTSADGPSVAELVIDMLQQFGPGTGSSFSGSSISGVNANATLTWTTQNGAIRISASVSNGALDGKSPQSQCMPAFEEDYCATATLSDGSVVMVQHGTGYPSGASAPTHNNMVSITRPDHAAINVVEWSDGPLTDDQLYRIVSDPRWGLQMAGSFVGHADVVVRPFADDGAGG